MKLGFQMSLILTLILVDCLVLLGCPLVPEDDSTTPSPTTTNQPVTASLPLTPTPGQSQLVLVSLTISDYGYLYFSSDGGSVLELDQRLHIVTHLSGSPSWWRWYLDNVVISTESTLTFSPSLPDTNTLSATTLIDDVSYTSSNTVTVS